jgi:hypothetical protein
VDEPVRYPIKVRDATGQSPKRPTDASQTAPQRTQHGDIGSVPSVVSAVLSSTTLVVLRALAIAAHEMIDLIVVLVYEALDLFTSRTGLGACIGHGTTQSNVVANEIRACWILQRILHIGLLYLEVTVDIATVVSLAAF